LRNFLSSNICGNGRKGDEIIIACFCSTSSSSS